MKRSLLRFGAALEHFLTNDKPAGQASILRKDGWAFTFPAMPEYRSQPQARTAQMVSVQYTVTAATVSGFTQTVAGNAKDGFTVTYTAIRKIPPTGDRTNLPLLAGDLVLSIGALIFLLRKNRKAS